jgi:hypothetical protein
MKIKTTILIIVALAALSGGLSAKNVDLVTLPERDSVQLTIYNSEDLTLVKETRSISLKKGANELQFSWANTLIDPTSVEFRPIEHESDVEVTHTIFPGQKPQHLIWHIESKFEGQIKVEVTYFTSGLSWAMDYVGVTDADETKMKFDGFVRVYNNSGEEYENAQIRLVVGTINLVEKIRELAQRRGIPEPAPAEEEYDKMREDSAREMMDEKGAGYEADLPTKDGKHKAGERGIIKEGLSEYFIFSIEGEETVKNGWSKRMRAVKAENVKFDIVYRMRSYQYGPRPVRYFIWKNDSEHGLGDSPMPDGRIRLFRIGLGDGLSFLGEQNVNYVPIKADIEINLGTDDLVVYETKKASTKRFNFHFTRPAWNEEYVDGWDEETKWIDSIKNYRTKPIVFELRRQWYGDVEYASEVTSTLFDYQTVETKFNVPARKVQEYPCTVLLHQGQNAKQNAVKLKTK